MPGYVKRFLEKYNYKKNKKQTTIRTIPSPASKFKKGAQNPISKDTCGRVDNKQRKRVQQVVGSM